MFSATGAKALLAGVSAAALTILAAYPTGMLPRANEPVDPVMTGTVGGPVRAEVMSPMPGPIAVDVPVAAPLNVALVVAPGWIKAPAFGVPATADQEVTAALDLVATGDRAGAYELAKTLTDDTQRRAWRTQWSDAFDSLRARLDTEPAPSAPPTLG